MTSNLLDHDFGSEEEDDDFNPGVQEDSDAEDVKPAKPSARANNAADEDDGESQNGDENAEGGVEDLVGDYDDDEEDEDEEEVQQMSRPAKRQRGGVYNFIEDEAGVDEEEDEGEDDEDELAEFGAETHPDDLDALPAGAETDDRRHRQLDRQRELDATMDAEKQAQMLKERYGRNRAAATDSVVVPKRLLLPSVEDPSIWGGRCKPGKEREVVYAIQKRIEERPPGSRNPIRIISAFERGKIMVGWFYCEARRQPDVTDGLEGINFYYPSQKLTLVPVKEMPDLLRVRKSEELIPGGWVRIKRGKYVGDLAQIEELETNGLNVTVRIVPRLEYGIYDGSNSGWDPKRKRLGMCLRPPQRLFSEHEAKKRHGKFLSSAAGLGGKSWNYLGDSYVDGFLIKDMRLQHLETDNVKPQLQEVEMFARGGEDGTSTLDLASLADTIKNTRAEDSYQPGDPVEVYRGEQQGLIGQTVSAKGEIVSIRVTEGDLAGQTIDAPVRTLRKRFREGDHVKVIGGSVFLNEVGIIIEVKDDNVTLLSDMTMSEITVFSKDVRLSAENNGDKGYNFYVVRDLVQLDAATVGCVIKTERNTCRILDQNGSVRDLRYTALVDRLDRLDDIYRSAVSTDRNGVEIRERDIVREAYGEQRTGTILHVYRSFLFLENKTLAENYGIFVVRCTNVVAVSARGGRPTGPDLSKMNPAVSMQKPGAGRGAQMPPPQRGRDRLVGKTVGVRKGRYKGLMGIVKDADDKWARIELYSQSKAVHIERDILTIKDPVTKQTLEGGRGRGGRTPYGGAPPARDGGWSGGRTPISATDSSRTPAWGSSSSARTPAWSAGGMAGSRTPAWKNDGNRTAYGDGSRTAYGGGNRTPAWNSGSRTPYDSSSGSGYDAFASGSRTPAWGNANTGNRTPAWGGLSNNQPQRDYDDAPTPGGYSAPTPGAYGAPTPGASAPTPGAWADNAPTPGGAFSAPTPGAGPKRGYDAPTPAPYDAPTPALGGAAATPGAGYDDDGGPRYDEGTPSP